MKRILLILLVPFLFRSINASACTIFTKHDDALVLAGNNEDYQYSYNSMYWIVHDESKYSRICFGISTYVQGGMNEKGLFYDGATCPKSEVPYDSDKAQLGMDAGEVILSECATVKEAVTYLENHNISASLGDHLMFADASGDAAVVEWVENEMRVISAKDNTLIATNFYLSEPDLGGYPCERYSMADKMLSGTEPITLLGFSDILCSTTQEWGDGGTKYSNVYDLKSLTVYTYEKGDFSKVAAINLRDELAKLAANEKSINNINTLFYQKTASVFGEEIVDYRNTAQNDTNTNETSSMAANESNVSDGEKIESSQIQTEPTEERAENNDSVKPSVTLRIVFIGAIAIIAILIYCVVHKMSKKAK